MPGCLGADNSKIKASLSTSQSGPYLKSGEEKICKTSHKLFHVPVPRLKQAPINNRWFKGYHCSLLRPSGGSISLNAQILTGYIPAFTGIDQSVPETYKI